MPGKVWYHAAVLWTAALVIGLEAGQARSINSNPAPAGEARVGSDADAAAVVAQAVGALADLDAKKLAAPFGGTVPAWARDWAERRGRDDLFERKWHGRAVLLPLPYHGAEWLAVFSMYHPVEADADHFHFLQERNGAWSLGAEISEREPATEYRINHHNLQVRLLPAEQRMTVTDRMTVQRLIGARGVMLARMSEDLDVQGVRIANAIAPFARAGGLLAIAIPLGPPASMLVQVTYQGVVHHPGMDDVDAESAFLFSYWYPNIARLPATGDVTVIAPAAWTVIAEGEQESRTEAGSGARTRWRQTHPVCWLQLAAGPYHRTSRTLGDKTLNVYLLKPNPRTAETAVNTLAQALPFFSRTFAPFPWTHYDMVEYPMTVGALEGYSMTAMSLELLRVALPHELSHSWWGGLVPNTYTIDMWNEAFASYSERLLSESAHPPPSRGLRPGENRPRGPRLPPRMPIIGAVDALDEPEAIVGYKKGAAVLHMFRRTFGEEAFHQTLTRFATEMAGKPATWRDFQRTAEAVTGHDLSGFFDPWLMRSDAPRLSWGPAHQDGRTLEAEIDLANPAYSLQLPIAIDTADGKRHIETVEVAGPRTHVRRAEPARVVRLVLDPAADFLLDPGDSHPNPWTLELPQTKISRTVRVQPGANHDPGRRGHGGSTAGPAATISGFQGSHR